MTNASAGVPFKETYIKEMESCGLGQTATKLFWGKT